MAGYPGKRSSGYLKAAEVSWPKSFGLFSCEGQGHFADPGDGKTGKANDRIGARAFLHLGGLCEPEPAKRNWLRK